MIYSSYRFIGLPIRAVYDDNISYLSNVATSGDYNDLINKPVITGGGGTQLQADWN
jgi:hypothetical protein